MEQLKKIPVVKEAIEAQEKYDLEQKREAELRST